MSFDEKTATAEELLEEGIRIIRLAFSKKREEALKDIQELANEFLEARSTFEQKE